MIFRDRVGPQGRGGQILTREYIEKIFYNLLLKTNQPEKRDVCKPSQKVKKLVFQKSDLRG